MTIKKIKTVFMVPVLIFHLSCEVTNLDDIELKYQILSENAFEYESSVEAAYAGMYNVTLFDSTINTFGPFYKGQQGILVGFGIFGPLQFLSNSYDPENVNTNLYSTPYEGINTINNFIYGVENMKEGAISEERKNEMLGEAKLLRAFNYFFLLTYYGQFWDVNSQYGMVLNTEPNTGIASIPRSSVQETYDLIFEDLDYAIANAPVFSSAIYASKEAAKGFKAKALMYAGSYAEAIPILEDLMTSNFYFEAVYDDIFENTFESSEVILTNYWDQEKNAGTKNGWYDLLSVATPYFIEVLTGDPRYDGSLKPNKYTWLAPTIDKWPSGISSVTSTIFMRLPEIYLMHAECVVRSGGSLSTAQASVDIVRARVGLATTGAQNTAELLEQIRIEKIKELGTETGVHFDDIIRYHYAGDIDGLSIKSTLSSEHLFIWPIPQLSITVTDGVVVQNPGY